MAEPFLRYTEKEGLFYWVGPYETRHIPRAAGWEWHDEVSVWVARSPYHAVGLIQYADETAAGILRPLTLNATRSRQIDDTFVLREAPIPEGRRLYPYQVAGAEYLADQIQSGRKGVLLADEQGLGKTAQAIAAANLLGARNLLVVCPASVRYVWQREIEAWQVPTERPARVVLSRRAPVVPSKSAIVSYSLAGQVTGHKPNLVILDEVHYLKNPRANRTKIVLGRLAHLAPVIALTGTPIPNRPNEIWPVLDRLGPDVIDRQSLYQFTRRYCVFQGSPFGEKIVGAQRHTELAARLRGSGFMIRRLKSEVLHELPPKTYKMVSFAPNGAIKEVLRREAAFSAKEIFAHGVPVGSALPEIRHEMALEKVPLVVRYVEDILDGGAEKVLVFAYHRDVIAALRDGLKAYGVGVIEGATSSKQRDVWVKQFQGQVRPRVLIGQINAAGVGLTLTRACDVVFAEASWVPGNNEQCADRVHRIGQTRGVVVHFPVVRGSLDAAILGAAAAKAEDTKKVLDRNT